MPRVSIGLPVYNGERFIEQSVRSVLDQTFRDLELIVSDNASTDGTLAILDRLAADDPRVRVVRNEQNRGAAWNYNRVFELASGELFRWHAHDDWFEPTLIERLVDVLDADREAVLAHSWTRFIDDDGETQREFHDDLGVVAARAGDRLRSVIDRLTFCNAVFGLARRDVLAETALIGAFPGSDVTLLYELALRGRFAVVPELLFVRRPGASIKANPTKRMVAQWFDPAAKRRRATGLQHLRATLVAIRRLDLGVGERLHATTVFLRVWPLEYARRERRRARRARA